MAQRVQVLLLCDIHGGEHPADETVTFSVDGTGYELDLCTQHATELRDTFAPYIGAGRRTAASERRSSRRRRRSGSSRATEIREWARGQGIAVSERGRISADVMAKYDASH
jgi:hypothetical protein